MLKTEEDKVVICFKFSNFAYANTVSSILFTFTSSLLFALNLVTLLMQIQLHRVDRNRTFCCYLL